VTGPPGRPCPVLTTARLGLGPHEVTDYPDMLSTWQNPVVVKYFGGAPSTAEECWARLLRYAGLWSLLGFGYWRIRDRANGRFVGEIGLAEFRRDITPSLAGWPEAGWVLAPWAHGQGFAREAAEAIFAWVDGVLGVERTGCLIDPGNAPSLTLAARLGFQPFAEARYKGRDSVLLERIRPAGAARGAALSPARARRRPA
jgi:RimJ/RimL family protein N-acetyltransferase